jgi:hypothetical protein
MSHTLRTVLASVALFIIAYILLWYAGLFDNLGFHGTVAAVLGVLLTSGVAVGLMTAMFHSNRSHHDEDVHRPHWRR